MVPHPGSDSPFPCFCPLKGFPSSHEPRETLWIRPLCHDPRILLHTRRSPFPCKSIRSVECLQEAVVFRLASLNNSAPPRSDTWVMKLSKKCLSDASLGTRVKECLLQSVWMGMGGKGVRKETPGDRFLVYLSFGGFVGPLGQMGHRMK